MEKVKGLLLLPNIEMATTQQVADFYEVNLKTLYSLVNENRDELLSDGYNVLLRKDACNLAEKGYKIHSKKGQTTAYFNDFEMKIGGRGVGLFTRRAILRVGMLLRNSEIAKEVRTQLLNIEEKTTNDVEVAEVNEELLLL